MLGDRIYTLATYNQALLIKFREMGKASAVGILILVLLFAFAYFYMKILGVHREE